MMDPEKQKADLDQLIANGHAMLLFMKDLKGNDPKNRGKVRINFKENYEHWYSEALAVIKQMLPDRLTDYTRLYKDPKIKKVTEEDFSLSDYVVGFSFVHDLFPVYDLRSVDTDGIALAKFNQQLSILEACKARFASSLFGMQPLQKADIKLYVNGSRLTELKSVKSKSFDLSRLIRYCEELNGAFSMKRYLSSAMLVRAIIDHVPPIFSKSTFSEVANNYGNKSFKDSMMNLENSSRKIADSHLHTQIRKKEVLPNANQIDFSNDLDVLLAEIVRILK